MNGKFLNGETTMKMSYDSLQHHNLHVKWDDITSNTLIDTAYTAIIKITEGIVIDDPSNFTLQKGSVQQFIRKIASLKGQIPSLGAGPNRLINDNSQMLAIVTDMEYPGINEGTGSKLVKQFEWTLPAGWRTTSNQYGTFITNPDVKLITIIPDKVNVGSIKVRAVNDIASAYSEYDSIYFDRGFSLTNYPTSITFADNSPKTFSTTLFNGITYEWSAPVGSQINGQGNNYEALNQSTVLITPKLYSLTDTLIKVRLKKDNEISSWHIFPTKITEFPKVTINSTGVYQYEEVDFNFTNINFNDVQSITCSGTGVHFIRREGQICKFVLCETGTVNVTINIMKTGYDQPIVLEKSITVNPYRHSISGAGQICSSETYTVFNLPASSQITWSTSNDLNVISGYNSTSAVIQRTNGLAFNTYISVSVSLFGYQFVLTKTNLQLGTKNPLITLYDASTHQQLGYAYTGQNCYFYAYGTDFSSDNNKYVWTITTPDPMEFPQMYIGRQVNFSAWLSGYYQVSLQYDGECGWSTPAVRNYYFEETWGEMLLYPNPTTDILNIELSNFLYIKEDNDRKSKEGYSVNSDNIVVKEKVEFNGKYEVQIWSHIYGLAKSYKSINESKTQIKLHNLPKGIYFVHLIIDNKTVARKIIQKN